MTRDAQGKNGGYIDRRYRARFLLRLSLIVASGAILLYLTLFAVFSRRFAGDYGSVFFALRNLASFLFPIVASSVLVYTLLICGATAVLCVYALHKVAGPLYRMERIVESYAAGDPVRTVFFRDGDQGMVLAREFNAFVARVREDRQKVHDCIDAAERAVARDPASCRADVDAAMAGIDAVLAKYR